MGEIFANRLLENDISWEDIPTRYQDKTLAALQKRVKKGTITQEVVDRLLNPSFVEDEEDIPETPPEENETVEPEESEKTPAEE